MRFMVEQKHTVRSRYTISFSGCLSASRFTRFSSVPTARALRHPDKEIVYLDRTVCFCSTMNRIDLPHLVWTLENLVSGTVVNRIEVDADTQEWARIALDRMLSLSD